MNKNQQAIAAHQIKYYELRKEQKKAIFKIWKRPWWSYMVKRRGQFKFMDVQK